MFDHHLSKIQQGIDFLRKTTQIISYNFNSYSLYILKGYDSKT